MTIEEYIKELQKYPSTTEIEVAVYDMGDFSSYEPELEYAKLQNKIYIHPNYDKED